MLKRHPWAKAVLILLLIGVTRAVLIRTPYWPAALLCLAFAGLFALSRSMEPSAPPAPPLHGARATAVAPASLLPPLEFHRTLEPREECVAGLR